MPGMTDQEQRDTEAQLRRDLAAVRRERDALRARMERVEEALRFYANPDNWFPGVGINRGAPCSVEADEGKRARAALGAAGEMSGR